MHPETMPDLAVPLDTQDIKFANSGKLVGRNLPSSFISRTEDLGIWCLDLEKLTLVLGPFHVLSSPVAVRDSFSSFSAATSGISHLPSRSALIQMGKLRPQRG